jgi:serine/threonine-protein kinase
MSSTPIEDRLGELLLRWDELRRDGRDVTAEELCGDCPDLAPEVKRRIDAVERMDPVLDIWATQVAETPGDQSPAAARANCMLPDALCATAVYRPRQRHAQGGLGEVLTAHEDELERLVALKRIRPDRLHEAARRRFLREAAITARLQHPGIVPVYGLGHDADGPFYTMPLIQGQTLQEAIDAFHGDKPQVRDPGQQSLQFRGLLQRLIMICNTVAYAHDQGIVHRDLKPSNIMLGPYGETLVLDWGLAKPLGSGEPQGEGDEESPSPGSTPEALTATGAILGTPRYMSPEQARGEPAGPASDVFSLGLILYAILTGKPAFDEERLREADPLRAVREAAVVPPRKRDPSIPRALEAVCQKTLAARPEDRYLSARVLAKDLENWLAEEPVTAWREPRSIRARRWMRRHRTWVAAAAGMMLVGILTLGIAYARESAYSRNLRQINLELRSANARVIRARTEADRRLDQTLQAIEDYYTGVGEEVLLGQKEFQPLRQRLLEKPRRFFEQLARELESSPSRDDRTRFLLAKGRFGLVRISSLLGKYAEARQEADEAIRVLSELSARNPSQSEYQKGLASCYSSLGFLQGQAGDETAAAQSLRQSITILSALVAGEPDSVALKRELARGYTNLSSAQEVIGKITDATGSLEEAISVLAKLSAAGGEVGHIKNDLVWSYSRLGDLQRLLRDFPAAMGSYGQAIAIGTELVAAHPEIAEYKHRLAQSHQGLGVVHRRSGNLAGAAKSHRSAAGIRETLVASRPNVPDYQHELAASYNNLGVVSEAGGDHRAAADFYQKAIKVRSKLTESHPSVPAYQEGLALSFQNLGDVYSNSEQLSKAMESHRQAIAIRSRLTKALPENVAYSENLAFSYTNCGRVQSRAGDHAGAVQAVSHAVEIRSKLVADHPNIPEYQEGLATSYASLASARTRAGNSESVLEPAQSAIGIFTKLVGAFPDSVYYKSGLAVAHEALGSAFLDLGQFREADQAFEKAIENQKFAFDRSPGTVVFRDRLTSHYAILGRSLRKQGRKRDAVQIALLRKSLCASEPAELYDVACELAQCMRIGRDNVQTKAAAAEAIEVLRSAIASGWNDALHLSRDPDLAPLHDEDAFRQLAAKLFDRQFPADPLAP